MQYICNSLYNLEVATTKAYNLLAVAFDPRSDKRIWSLIKLGFKSLLKISEKLAPLKHLYNSISATGTGVMGN